ncbi:MAG: phage integrase N-terminal SAM-like domain-containing protein [Balneolaceae bacterium]
MKRSLILSSLRIELRRKQAGYPTEKNTIRWVRTFLDQMSIVHSSQIRNWQRDLFLSELKNMDEASYEEQLQAKSSLLFLYDRVLKQTPGFASAATTDEPESSPGSFRITG